MISVKPGETYYSDWKKGKGFKVKILRKPSMGNVLIQWLEGPLKGREARVSVRGLAKST